MKLLGQPTVIVGVYGSTDERAEEKYPGFMEALREK